MGECSRAYKDFTLATMAAYRATEKAGTQRVPYRCATCGGFHVGTPRKRAENIALIKTHGGFSRQGAIVVSERT